MSIVHIGSVMGMVIAFTVIALTLGRIFASWAFNKIRQKTLPEPGTSLTFICIMGLLCG